MNSSTAENFMRSAKAPTIRPQVMAAKVSWKATKIRLGQHHALAEGGGHGIRRHALQEQLVEAAEEGACPR
jgi:hypothetical protein